jgi:tetratricopeptide (TPR) repeat protein
MKGLMGFLLLLAALSAAVEAETPGDLWRQGHSLYASGQYEAALGRFQALQKQSDHWRIHANLGNCLFKLDRHLEAKAAWIRAWGLKPGHSALVKNLAVVNARLGVEDLLLRQNLWQKAASRLESLFSLSLGALLLIAALFVFNAALLLWIQGRLVRPARYAVLLTFLLSIFLGTHQAVARGKLLHRDLAVVRAEKVSLYSGPGDHHTPLFALPRGLTVEIRERRDRWLRVAAGNDVAGWVRPDWLIIR